MTKKTKFKITFTVTVEYEVNPENYPGCTTDEQRLAVDFANANDDPFMFMSENADWKMAEEILKGGEA